MPATVTLVRPTFNNNDTLEAPGFNAVTLASASVPDATPADFGVIKLAGDLEGTAAAPSIKVSLLTVFMRTVTAAATAAAVRILLELGDSSTKNVGTGAGTVAAGDDSRMTNARTPTAHNHPVGDITGLGNSATRAVGTTAGTVAAGDDSRMTNARTPTAHNHPVGDITGLGALATLGTVNNGNWSGTALAVANGGTGGTTQATGRTGLGIGSIATRALTATTGTPSGGADGDIHLQYT